MIATQTQPNLTLYSWDVFDGMAVLRCRSEDGIGDVALGFTSLAELESFATAAAQMAQDYRLSLSGEEAAPPMSEVDRLLVEAVVSSRPTHAADPGNAAASDAYLAQPPTPPDYAARNLAICNKARVGVGQPPLTQAEYDDLPF